MEYSECMNVKVAKDTAHQSNIESKTSDATEEEPKMSQSQNPDWQ